MPRLPRRPKSLLRDVAVKNSLMIGCFVVLLGVGLWLITRAGGE